MGVWGFSESELRVLGEVEGKDVLELGCGAAQMSIGLADETFDVAFADYGAFFWADPYRTRFVHNYFGLRTLTDPDGSVSFHLPYGEWIRLLRRCGLVLEDLLEPQPDPSASSTYRDGEDLAWSRRWPAECIWRARKS